MRSFAIEEAPSLLPTLYVTLLPSVVGPPESKFFLISSIVSLTNKLILLTVAVLLVLYTNIDTNPLLLWCQHNKTIDVECELNQTRSDIEFCQFPKVQNICLPSCWNPEERGLYHKIRICGEKQTEHYVRFCLLGFVILSSALSALASYHLHKLSDYIQLYKKTQSLLLCIQTRPEVHRSVLFRLSKDDRNEKELEEMLQKSAPRKNQYNPMVNRPNSEGETPLHNSTKAGAKKCTEVLLKTGAIPKKNFDNKFPEIGSSLGNQEVVAKMMEVKKRGFLSNQVLTHLKRQSKVLSSTSEQLIELLKYEGSGSFFTKQDVTIWEYSVASDGGQQLRPSFAPGRTFVEVQQLNF